MSDYPLNLTTNPFLIELIVLAILLNSTELATLLKIAVLTSLTLYLTPIGLYHIQIWGRGRPKKALQSLSVVNWDVIFRSMISSIILLYNEVVFFRKRQ